MVFEDIDGVSVADSLHLFINTVKECLEYDGDLLRTLVGPPDKLTHFLKEMGLKTDYSPLKPVNITVFRLTAKKMLSLGVANKNTGDARGDVEFYMGRFLSLVNCTPPGPGTTFSSTRSL